MQTENEQLLAKHFPEVWTAICDQMKNERLDVIVERSLRGLPTIRIERNERKLYLHSKYDPIFEAECFIEQFTNLERYKQVFVFGVGMGYHIEALAQKAPHLKFILYEPDINIFRQCISTQRLSKWPLNRISKFLVQGDRNIQDIVSELVESLHGEALFVTLPSYERVFSDEYKSFAKKLRQGFANKRFSLTAVCAFEKRWVLNSIVNFKYLLETPNIILDKKSFFKGRPALLVSAGPSLNDEIDNIRYIKDNGLAFVISVGSAIKTLTLNGIVPDFACAYDPSQVHGRVFADIIEAGQDTFPLVFGSTITYEVLELYQGPKLHMNMNRDILSRGCLRQKNGSGIPVIHDASSVATVTLELLSLLGCEPIYLVGQNMAYKNNQRYAGGINYSEEPADLNEKEIKEAIPIEDVHGETAYTSEAFLKMRADLELLIEVRKISVYNTTNGGAKIRGADYIPLSAVIVSHLKDKVVCSKEDITSSVCCSYDQEYIAEQLGELNKSYIEFKKHLKCILESFEHLKKLVKYKNEAGVQRELKRLGPELLLIDKNIFYRALIEPMEMVQSELVKKKIARIGEEIPLLERAERLLNDCYYLFHASNEDHKILEPFLKNLFMIGDNKPMKA